MTVLNIEEIEYKFPIDYNSAFCNLVVTTPRKKIQTGIQKNDADKNYKQSKSIEFGWIYNGSQKIHHLLVIERQIYYLIILLRKKK